MTKKKRATKYFLIKLFIFYFSCFFLRKIIKIKIKLKKRERVIKILLLVGQF